MVPVHCISVLQELNKDFKSENLKIILSEIKRPGAEISSVALFIGPQIMMLGSKLALRKGSLDFTKTFMGKSCQKPQA